MTQMASQSYIVFLLIWFKILWLISEVIKVFPNNYPILVISLQISIAIPLPLHEIGTKFILISDSTTENITSTTATTVPLRLKPKYLKEKFKKWLLHPNQ